VLKSREARRRTEQEAAERARLLAEAEKQRLERIKITRARNRNIAVGLGALLLLAWALWQTLQANSSTREAAAQKKVADERTVAAQLAEQKAAEKDSMAQVAAQNALEQARIADLKSREALSEKDRAELAILEARQQQRRANTASIKVVQSLLKDARADVLHLQYDAAVEKLRAAAEVGQLRDSVGLALMEPAFFYAESGQFPKAYSALSIARPLLGKPKPAPVNDRAAAQKSLRALSDERYQTLVARYYPMMLDIPAGRFMMGDSTLRDNSQPVHEVQLAAFKLAETETTFWQWGLYCAASRQAVSDFSPPWGIDGDNPVVNQTWYQAVDYANWLSSQFGLKEAYLLTNRTGEGEDLRFEVVPNPDGKGFRLPSEAEWEYAARGNERYLYAGSDNLDEVGWYDDNSISKPHPVGRKKANRFGLYDMSGNVWEWCEDAWHENYEGAPMDGSVWMIDGDVDLRVVRGGSWYYYTGYCRVAFRYWVNSDIRSLLIGFRLAR
jgi:formylglycine-generating enzyme required for sulfatase activity